MLFPVRLVSQKRQNPPGARSLRQAIDLKRLAEIFPALPRTTGLT
jgi:hypothetical protein